MNVKAKKAKPRNGQPHIVRFPGITEDAKKLGVSRPHLWMVLTGRRESRVLTERYHQLKGEAPR